MSDAERVNGDLVLALSRLLAEAKAGRIVNALPRGFGRPS